eukprot:GHVU01205121.1.p1 GENE.GHVU01205121.1~~GHVU01205121.1.p1  ORF type:complete len:136 (+),score=13.16 GHVU01205121.1:147-554(+)
MNTVANLSWTSNIEVGQTTDQPPCVLSSIIDPSFLPSHPSTPPTYTHPSTHTHSLNQSINRTIDQSPIGTAAAPSEADTTSATTIHLFGCRIKSTLFVSSTVDSSTLCDDDDDDDDACVREDHPQTTIYPTGIYN